MRYLHSLFLVVLLAAGCGDNPAAPEEDLQGGVLATFSVEGEPFHVWITRPETIEQVLALEAGTGVPSFPNGPLREGPGPGDHNAPWTWHLDPDETVMAELTIEVCSGRPSYVEEHREEWLGVVGQYCPWGAELVAVEDLR